LGVALGLAAAAAAGVWGWRLNSRAPRGRGGEVVVVKQGPIENTVEATGSVAALNRVELKPPITGRMEQLIVDEGAEVKAGQIMAWMSSSDRAAILDAARAQGPESLKRWEDSYKPTPIVAPLSGTVILRNFVVAQTVDNSVLYAVADTLIVVAQVDESDIGRIRAGMPARITLDSYPDRVVQGKVFEILFEGKNVSNVIQYFVKLKIEPVPEYFRSQMSANVSFIIERKPRALLIPAAAVRELGGGVKQVLIHSGEGQPPAPREIKTGVESGESVEVLSGLSAGDKVMIARARYVPQPGPQASPLTLGGRPSGPSGQAPKQRRNSGS
jgi:macrolide-specific efflux system membrane fusion protein